MFKRPNFRGIAVEREYREGMKKLGADLSFIGPAICLLVLALVSPKTEASLCRAADDSCDFYLCKEQENPCGKKGYWLGYGHKYCDKFLQNEARFSEASRAWFKSVRYCLQDEARLFNNHESCDDSYNEAMNSHVDCYVEADFCSLPLRDRAQVLWTLRAALLLPVTYVEGLGLQLECMSERHIHSQ